MNTLQHAPDRASEEGASATLFVIVLTALLAVTMLAIDGGSLFVSRRGQVADTDSAALAVAASLADNPCLINNQSDIDAVAEGYIDVNDPSDSSQLVDTVDVVPTGVGTCPQSGLVEVSTIRDANLYFAGVFGYERIPTSITAGAEYGQATSLEGLRPIGMCEFDPHYLLEGKPWWQSLHGGPAFDAVAARTAAEVALAGYYPTLPVDYPWHPTEDSNGTAYTSDVHRMVFFSPDSGNACGEGVAGHFGWLDLDGNGGGDVPHNCDSGVSPKNELNCDVNTGFNGRIWLDPADCRPNSDDVDRCEAEPGEVAAARSGLESIRCDASLPADHESCETIFIVIYGADVVQAGGASEEQFRLVSVIGLVIRDYQATGAPKNHYVDIEFVDEVVGATSIGPLDIDSTAPLGYLLCAVEEYSNCHAEP